MFERKRLTNYYQVGSLSPSSIGHETKYVVITDCIDVFDRTTNKEITAICSATNKNMR